MLKKLLIFMICLLFLSSIASAAWLGDGSTRRQKITIQGAFLDANQTHFPVYVYIDPAAEGATMGEAANDGSDIRFTESDGTTLLDHELEYWSGGGGGAVTAHFWVSNAGWTIESDGSTELYVYYGSAGADGENAVGVWDANYMLVMHFNEAAGHPQDSGPEANHAIDETVAAYEATGKIKYGIEFTPQDWIEVTNTADFTVTAFTVDIWMEGDNVDVAEYFFAFYDGTSTDGIQYYQSTEGNGVWRFKTIVATNSVAINSDAAPTQSFELVSGVREADGTMKQYIDGAIQVATDTNAGEIDSSCNVIIGAGHAKTSGFDGIMDEVRFSDVARSANWLKFQAKNILEGDNELTFSAEEEAPSDGFVPKVIIIR